MPTFCREWKFNNQFNSVSFSLESNAFLRLFDNIHLYGFFAVASQSQPASFSFITSTDRDKSKLLF